MLYLVDLFGIAVFAVTGALVAGERRMDLVGVLVLAVVTAVGGGTLRDLLIDAPEVFWVEDPVYIVVALVAGLLTVVVANRHPFPRRALPVADAIGLAFFAVIGAERAYDAGVSPLIAIVMGVITGVVGGLLRDVIGQRVPYISRSELYASAALLGASVYVVLTVIDVGRPVAVSLGVVAALAVRLAAIRWRILLPVFEIDEPASAGKEDRPAT